MLVSKIFLIFFALLVSSTIGAPIPVEKSTEVLELSARGNKFIQQAVGIVHQIRKTFRPKSGEAVFWSGTKPGKNGGAVSVMGDAKRFAKSHNKSILTQVLAAHSIRIPSPKENPHSHRLWNIASKLLALRAHGDIHAVLGQKRRPGNVYDNIEKPTLLRNPKVTKLIEHNVETKKSTVVKGG